MKRVIASCWFHPWIPRSKIICSNWELISRFRCLLASWIPRFDFFKVRWEVQYCKCFKIQVPHSLWFLKWHKNYLSGNCFSLRCKYFVKQFPVCCFILKNGNSWRKEQLISSKKSKSRSFFSWSGNSWFPGSRTTKNNRRSNILTEPKRRCEVSIRGPAGKKKGNRTGFHSPGTIALSCSFFDYNMLAPRLPYGR